MLDIRSDGIPLEYSTVPTIIKAIDKIYTVQGETLVYTITIKNNDVADISNVYLLDTLPNCETFLENSVTLNGLSLLGANINPPSSIPIGSINPGSISTVTFEILLSNSPCNIENNPYIKYTNSDGLSDYAYPNTVTINIEKYQDAPIEPNIGDVITYTIIMQNIGNTSANNAILLDTIPSGTTFIPNSMILNGQPKPGLDPSVGVSLGNILPGSLSIAMFKVTISTIPITPYTIINCSNLTYSYTVDSTNPNSVIVSKNSNCVYLPINQQRASISVIKSVDKNDVLLGETLTYTINIISNFPANIYGGYLSDIISPCMTFIPGSITLNSIPQPSANIISPNSISIGTIAPGKAKIVTFQVTATTCPCTAKNSAYVKFTSVIPNIYIQSNTVTTTISCPTNVPLKIEKDTCNCINCLGEQIPYDIKVTNISSSVINNIVVDDIVPSGIYISSTTVSSGNISELSGKLTWTIPSLQPGSSAIAMVIMIGTDSICFDNHGYIINTATIVSYNGKPTLTNISDTSMSYIDCFCCNCKK
ncbi:MAG: DUF11 domain-containing protein [Romboutsia sp.]